MLVRMESNTVTLKNSMEGLKNFKGELPYDLVISLLGIVQAEFFVGTTISSVPQAAFLLTTQRLIITDNKMIAQAYY